MGSKTISFDELPSALMAVVANLEHAERKSANKTCKKAQTEMIKTARDNAPYMSGDTVKGIKGLKHGDGYKVISTVDDPFPHNIWNDNRIVGGRGSIPYPWVQKTGIRGGGFFTKAIKSTKIKFKEIILKDISYWEMVK